jgi:MFS family permease
MTDSAAMAARPGWYHGWNIIAVCVLSQIAANGLEINSFSLFLKDWSAELHSQVSTLQLGVALMGMLSSILAPVAGIFADKYPSRLLFGVGLACLTLCCLGLSYVTAIWQFFVCYGLMPIGLVTSTTLVANAVVSRWFVRRRGLALGITAFGVGIAGALLPPLISLVMPVIGWRLVWRFAGLGIGLIILPLVVLTLREQPGPRDGTYYVMGKADAHGHHGGGNLTWRDVLGRKNFWLMLGIFIPLLAINGGTANNLAPIAASHGLSAQMAGSLLAIFGAAHVVATLVTGVLSDRFGNRLPLAGLAFSTALGALLVGLAGNPPLMALGVVLVGASGGMWTLLAASAAAEFGAANIGRAFGLLTMFIPMVALAPFFVAKTHEATGGYAMALIGFAALASLGGIGALFMQEASGGQGSALDPLGLGAPDPH